MTEQPAAGPTKTTPLHDRHEARGAKFTNFSGYDMPLQFEGILAEHQAVRDHAGIFDVSHMSNLEVPGDEARALAHAIGADVTDMPQGKARYTLSLSGDGTILDDIMVMRLADRFHIVPNAGMNEDVAAALERAGCSVTDRTDELCILAIQGPEAREIIAKTLGEDHLADRFRVAPLHGVGLVSGTGYTGEPGVEFIVPSNIAEVAWEKLTEAGVTPCGLGARDTLRLEMGYCLAGNEFDPPVTPVEAGLMWTLDMGHSFTGRDKVETRREAGPETTLTGLRLTDRGIPRRDCPVHLDGQEIGRVSSGTMSPTLKTGIALAYLDPAHTEPGTEVTVEVRGKALAGVVEKPPFVDR